MQKSSCETSSLLVEVSLQRMTVLKCGLGDREPRNVVL